MVTAAAWRPGTLTISRKQPYADEPTFTEIAGEQSCYEPTNLFDTRAIRSSVLERKSLRSGDVLALW